MSDSVCLALAIVLEEKVKQLLEEQAGYEVGTSSS
jgi:hypothetical protein